MLGLLSAVAGPLIKGIFGTVDELVEDKDLAAKLKTQLQVQSMDIVTKQLDAARDIIMAEVNSGSWLAANWRPMIMVLFGVIIANNYLIAPIFGTPVTDIPSDMWDLLKLGLGGYVVGRTVEKSVKVWKQ